MGSTVAKLFFLAFFFYSQSYAQVFSLPFSEEKTDVPIDQTIQTFEKLDVDSTDFEEKFRVMAPDIERQLDLMRSDCQEKGGEASARQRCFREVVRRQKRYFEISYKLKKSLLVELHKRQLSQLELSKDTAIKELDKQF